MIRQFRKWLQSILICFLLQICLSAIECTWFLFVEYLVFQSRRDLSGRDCLFLAQHAFADGYYDTALQWAEAALSQFARKGDSYGAELEVFRNEVKHFVEFASRVVRHNNDFALSAVIC